MSKVKINLSGFSKLARTDRIQKLKALGLISESDAEMLILGEPISFDLAENLIENSLGYFPIPLGVATNFRIDNEDYAIPMAVEETSIIAAASCTAKWVLENGEITTSVNGKNIIGQIQLAKVRDTEKFRRIILEKKSDLMKLANAVAENLVKRGGGVTDIEIREIDRGDESSDKMMVLHVLLNPRDAMGANIMNQICEALKEPIQSMTGESVTMCILSNLVDTKLTNVTVRIRNVDPEIGRGIAEASLFSKVDPYRAATNNKGVLNGIDAVVLATGNDWRAVEAGIHAYASRDGQYRSITSWEYTDGDLVGRLTAPIVVGTVGGVTQLHPVAKLCLNMLGVESAEHLSRIIGAVGLVQNLGALKALSTVGIVKGHMKLHTTNLALAAGASKSEISGVRSRLEEILKNQKRVSLSQAIEVLENLRRDHAHTISPQ